MNYEPVHPAGNTIEYVKHFEKISCNVMTINLF